MTTLNDIEQIESEWREAQIKYLQRHGWKLTCNTPGAYWLWVRDFADQDERRRHNHPATASPFQPWGVITATTDIAVQMTARVLDTSDDGDDGE